MHGDLTLAATLLSAAAKTSQKLSKVELVVLPPAPFIPLAEQYLHTTSAKWGAQHCHFESSGAFTGEISVEMLAEFHAHYVLVGHSERRHLFAESDVIIAKKFKKIHLAGLHPILCVGETLAEREAGQTEAVILRQLEAVLSYAGIEAFANAVLAYEPVWAIGTGRSASPEEAQAVHVLIRHYLIKYDKNLAKSISILYGGSVKPANAGDLFAMPDINGGLIGGASLIADEFTTLALIAEEKGNA
ncbi:MAG: triosephosphate isomerase [Gammaproteobacteria bacterium]|nr:triosephosphate isomerase [Gammaproteobacteria bacterium]